MEAHTPRLPAIACRCLVGLRLKPLVPKGGLEPPHPCEYMDLNHARLPIPPLRHVIHLAGQARLAASSSVANGGPGVKICSPHPGSPLPSVFLKKSLPSVAIREIAVVQETGLR